MWQLNFIEIFTILGTHFIGDFVCQTHWQALNKSKNNKALVYHTLGYTGVWYLVMFFFSVWHNHFGGPSVSDLGWSPWMWLFLPITFVAHTITDYFTSRLNSKLWLKGDTHNFFVSVGFDQVLHYIQLFTTYYLLKKA